MNKIKHRNRGEQAEDLITNDLGAVATNDRGAVDHHLYDRKIGDKAWGKANPTILNGRRVLCRIDPPLTDKRLQQVKSINTNTSKYDRISEINSFGSKIIFVNFDNELFEKCLQKIDPNFPTHLGQSIIDWRLYRPKKSSVNHQRTLSYPTYSLSSVDDFLWKILLQKIKPDGLCNQNIDDLIFVDKNNNKRCFILSRQDHKATIIQLLRENAYFDCPTETRYPTELNHDFLYLPFQIRLKYHKLLINSGLNEKDYIAIIKPPSNNSLYESLNQQGLLV